MVAELGVAMASSSGSAPATISHEGVVNVTISQDSVNQLMEGAQASEAAASSVNESTGIEAINMIMKVTALVIRVLVRLCVDVSAHVGNFEAIVESIIQLLQGHLQDTSVEAAKKGYETITGQIDKQSIVVCEGTDQSERVIRQNEAGN